MKVTIKDGKDAGQRVTFGPILISKFSDEPPIMAGDEIDLQYTALFHNVGHSSHRISSINRNGNITRLSN